ncbi:uncharacterized protein (TIGR02680 family) [Hydrogenispora ethanolica]|uniref:Uncharacterized protein (TIGR02680 family) n=1 Tax=Hydrogenispora ethanolica TaxID=1082276 RepID=A0A4R1R7H1_HYDET|nr:TIGR02680 family protein [Hydrogenispora ethanolica]TCL61470.1 uncharacterized protein (TIGR02680 family) [Hydrogenispora ethanolica]
MDNPVNNKWRLNRAGFLNYWYYDDEEFDFAAGRLLLRGSNGSGKSVTMQSLITVLLDGVKSPDRLDSFGSRSRRIEDYLLGEKELVGRDERTGYLYLEYKREHTEQYLTTGIGLQARRNGGLDFWGFVITDNRRIKIDLFLYKPEINPEDGSEQRIPLTRAELERSVDSGGQVVRSQKEYMELVNRYIFGFETIEQYQELMKLLIQLRSPKLSKDFKPSVIYEILNESLPSLSDEELRPLSETIESMERTKLQIEQLERDNQALGRLCRQYDQYNRYVLFEKAELAQKTKQRLARLERETGDLSRALEDQRLRLAAEQRRQSELEQELNVLQREKVELEQHDVFRAEQQKQERERQLEQVLTARRDKAGQLAAKERRENEERQLARKYEQGVAEGRTRANELLQELADAAVEAGFDEHAVLARAFSEHNPAFSFTAWRQNVKRHLEKLEAVLAALRLQAEKRQLRERIEQELGEERRLLDGYRAEHRRLEQRFVECRDQLLADFYQWRQQHSEALPMEQEELRQVAQAFQGLYEGRAWSDVKAPVETAYGRRITAINQELGLANAKIKQLEERERALNGELAEWQRKPDPEPDRLADNQATRSLLTERGIPYLPLYAAVEFQPQVPPELRERIEAALTEMGLLDALIVPGDQLKRIPAGDTYGALIHPNPQIMAATLADYLYPTPDGQGVTAADIDAALRSVLVEEKAAWTETAPGGADCPVLVAADGVYHSAILSGRAPRRQAALYIGSQARQEYRREQMARLEQQLAELGEEQENLYAVCTELRKHLAQAGRAMEEFLAEREIREIYHAKQAVLAEIGRQEQRVEQVDARLRAVAAELQALRGQLQTLGAGLKLPLHEADYQTARQAMGEYQHHLHELELAWRDYQNHDINAGQCRERLMELAADVDGLKGELLVLDDRIAGLRLEIDQIVSRLQEMGADELWERAHKVAKRLEEIPRESRELSQTIARLETGMKTDGTRMSQALAKIGFYERLSQCWQQVCADELRLGLVYPGDQPLPELNDILQQQEKLLKQDKLDRLAVTERLIERFHIENNVLMEYRMQLEPVIGQFGEPPQLPEEAEPDDSMVSELEKLQEKAQRQIITLDYDGRRQNPYQMQKVLETQITEQKSILSDKDKELYEEVIMNSIGRIISRRIQAAQQWVADMNELMGQRDNSSGLRFKLEWKARLAEQEEELDIQDLVRLLHADPALLREDDLQKIVRHFQSRIERAKRASEGMTGAENALTFQRAVREVLDYRLWFQFKLLYEQSGIAWRELTDKMFFKFSGGEKAMAMYIPLFSAAYSRYQEARPDAPYIITLDEAFAGVDENNIRDTFALVEQLGFNYILNSQALWGDYDVVPSLSVCELIRPKNAPYVTVVRYHWNGRVRSLMPEAVPEELVAAAAEP